MEYLSNVQPIPNPVRDARLRALQRLGLPGPAATQGIGNAANGLQVDPSLPPLPPESQLPPEDPADPGLLRRAADGALGGLSMVGNFLDLPGSSIRDMMTWLPGGIAARNPLDQWLTPFSDDNRTSGEDILANAGLVNDGASDSTLGGIGKFAAGTALEIGLDPLTYLTLGGSAVLKGTGGLAKRAGMMGDAAAVASKKYGREIGPRRAKQLVTNRDLAENVNQLASAPRTSQYDDLDALLGMYDNGTSIPPDNPLTLNSVADSFGVDIAGKTLTDAVDALRPLQYKPSTLGSDRLLDAYNGANNTAIKSLDDLPADALDGPLGGNFRVKIPGFDERIINDIQLPPIPGAIQDVARGAGEMLGSIPIPKTGKTVSDFIPQAVKDAPGQIVNGRIKGNRLAEMFDKAEDKFWYGNSVVPPVAATFTKALRGTKSKIGQLAAGKISKNMEASAQAVRDELYQPLVDLHELGYLKGDADTVRENGFAMTDYMEGVTNELPESIRVAQPILDKIRGQYAEQMNFADEVGQNQKSLGDVLEYDAPTRDADGNLVVDPVTGQPVIETKALTNPLDYAFRARQLEAGPLWRANDAKRKASRLDSKDGSAIGRQDYMRHLPTSTIQRMSINEKYAGVYDTGDVGKGRRKRMPDFHEGRPDTGVMGSAVRDPDSADQLYAEFVQDYDPMAMFTAKGITLEPEAVDAVNDAHRELFNSITRLKRSQVEKKIPMFAVNPVESALKKLESSAMNAASTVGIRNLVAENARLIGSPGTSGRSMVMAADGTVETANPMAKSFGELGSKLDPQTYTRDPIEFRKLSQHHDRFANQISGLVDSKTLEESDADILRMVMSQASPEGMAMLNRAKISGVDSLTAKSGEKAGGQWRWQVGDNGLLEFNIDVARDRGKSSGLQVLLHELGHMAQFSYTQQPGNDWGGDLAPLINNAQKNDRLLTEFSGLHGEKLGEYLNYTFDEQFPQLFADSIVRRKVPQGELGKIITGARDWIVQILQKMKVVKSIPKPTQKKIDQIIDQLMGFDESRKLQTGSNSATAAPLMGRVGTSDVKNVLASSDLAKTKGNNLDAINLTEVLPNAGIDYDIGMQRMVDALGDTGQQVADEITTTKRDGFLGEAFAEVAGEAGNDSDEFIAMLRNNYDADPDSFRTDFVGSMQDPRATKKALAALDAADTAIASPTEVLSRFEMDSDLARDITAVNTSFKSPEETRSVMAAYDAFTNLFKTNVTAPFPSFHTRNAMSGFVQNALNGIHDPTKKGVAKYIQPYKDVVNTMQGKAVEGARDIPAFVRLHDQWISEGGEAAAKLQGAELATYLDNKATEEIRKQIFARKLVDSPGDHNDLIGSLGGNAIDAILGKQDFKSRVKAPEGTTWGEALNPLQTPSLKGGDKAKFAPERYGRVIGNTIEESVRGAPFIALLKQGYDPDAAADMVKRLQVDYSDLGDTERKIFRRGAPFYTFQKGAAKYLASELAQRPGGPVAMTIKAAENASGNDPGAPEHIRQGLNIPIGDDPDGTKHYLTGAGLMHEPPMQMLGPDIQSTLFNAAGMLHPAIKVPFELLTNESLFQEGPGGGGRSLDDLDPLLGRTASNIGNTLGLTDRTAAYRVGKIPEELIANSPIARYLHQVRKLTDPRKGIGTKTTDFLTGAKIATVDPEAQDAVLREQVESLMRDMGGRQFSNAYIPDSVMATLQGDELAKAKQMQALLKLLNNRQRQRKTADTTGVDALLAPVQ